MTPALPPGFQLETAPTGPVSITVRGDNNSPPPAAPPPLPPGFQLESPNTAQPAPAPETPQPNEAMTIASQGASGFNTGLAKAAGFPVDAMSFLLNKGIEGANALGAHVPEITHPIGGSEMLTQLMSPTIAPPTNDTAGQVVRRIGEEAGSYAIPGMGLAAKSAKPLATLGAELASSLTAGTAAATAQQVAPGNPWAELTAELAGGFTPGAVMNGLKRAAASKVAPTLEELTNAKNAAYTAADNSGVRYSAPAFRGLAANIIKGAIDDHISATRHPVAASMLGDIAKRADNGHAPTMTELDQLRQEIRRDVIDPSYVQGPGGQRAMADAHFGHKMVDQIDEFIAGASPRDVVSGNPAKAAALITTARDLNTRMRKGEIIQDAISRARLNASSSGSGGNINNALRQAFKSILTSKSKLRSFSPQERAMINGLVRQNRMDDLLRWVGKASPGGSGLVGMLELGATMVHPGAAALPVAGFTAKAIADARTVGKAEKLGAMVRRGGEAAKVVPTPAQIAAAKAQLVTELQNLPGSSQQRQPLEITVPYAVR